MQAKLHHGSNIIAAVKRPPNHPAPGLANQIIAVAVHAEAARPAVMDRVSTADLLSQGVPNS